jgi:ubiquitin C-terminal hydrolase
MLWKPPVVDVPRASMPAAGMMVPSRDVARPVANLGNTCYMNAVLQALAHAPELCMAMDCEPHRSHCPIALENTQKRRLSPSSSPDNNTMTTTTRASSSSSSGHRKSRRSGKRSPSSETNSHGDLFCALCSVEEHLEQVHSNDTTRREDPVAPSTFVHGFIDHVAPWFKLGVQEDSHEFLRLLIDAMQKSCHQARTTNQQDINPTTTTTSLTSSRDDEYPFSLFRGTVESNVTCDSCRHSSSTLDPIEDIGLEVTPCTPLNNNDYVGGTANINIGVNNNNSTAASNSSTTTLADVSCAFQRFARVEDLDAGYKCETCGKVGRATKQSRLASIPPILTIHLKRFRYGMFKHG